MSNGLSRAFRRSKAFKERKASDDRAREQAAFQKSQDEVSEVLEHEYMGIAFAVFSVVCRDNHISMQRIAKIVNDADKLMGQMHRGEVLTEDLIQMTKEKGGLILDFDEKQHYAVLSHFANKDNFKVLKEISGVRVVEE